MLLLLLLLLLDRTPHRRWNQRSAAGRQVLSHLGTNLLSSSVGKVSRSGGVPQVRRVVLRKVGGASLRDVWWNRWSEGVRMRRRWSPHRRLLRREEHRTLVGELLLRLRRYRRMSSVATGATGSMAHKGTNWRRRQRLLGNDLTHNASRRHGRVSSGKVLIRLVVESGRVWGLMGRLLEILSGDVCRLLPQVRFGL